MVLHEISLNLISVADQILLETSKLEQNDTKNYEYRKNGRTYKLVNDDHFEAIRESDKYLIVAEDYTGLKSQLSLVSSYRILSKIEGVVEDYPDLCLAIMGAAREIELNKWYDLGVCVTLPQDASYELDDELMKKLLKFASQIDKHHINIGLLILCCSKINFFHTDHTLAKQIDGSCLKALVSEWFDPAALTSEKVYNAIRCFSHWGSIRGVLYKLELPNLMIDQELKRRFDSFPLPPPYLKESLFERYPAGTSKYSLCKKSLILIGNSIFGELLQLNIDIKWLIDLCDDIETDPCKYHLRASLKQLSKNPVDLSKLPSPNDILRFCSCVMNSCHDDIWRKLLMSSKFPKKRAIKSSADYVTSEKVWNLVKQCRQLGWSDDEIVAKYGLGKDSLRFKFQQLLI